MKYARYRSDQPEPRETINPVWRGIGCILFVITPFTALAVANQLVVSGIIQHYIYLPPSMQQPLTIPIFNYTISHFIASLAVAAVITFVLYTFYFTFYALLYRIVGPSPYGPLDAPPVKGRRNRRKSR